MNKMTNDIPAGHTKEDIKAREKLIKDFYANWIAENTQRSNQDLVQTSITLPPQTE